MCINKYVVKYGKMTQPVDVPELPDAFSGGTKCRPKPLSKTSRGTPEGGLRPWV